jgi:hypothetical protein
MVVGMLVRVCFCLCMCERNIRAHREVQWLAASGGIWQRLGPAVEGGCCCGIAGVAGEAGAGS